MNIELPKYAFPTSMDAGMELRDWFAGLAMHVLLQQSTSSAQMEASPGVAYYLADAMLEARKKDGAA